ncbi:MAG: esterase [Burkholderiaceae bacterium]
MGRRQTLLGAVLAICLALACSACAPLRDEPAPMDGPLSVARQGSFFIGGRDLRSDTLSTLPNAPAAGTVVVEQMYVQYQVPPAAKRHPLVLVHGCCLTGASWESTPDGRMGWAEYFVRRGYPAYVVDQVARGRSAADASSIGGVKLGRLPAAQLPAGFAVGREFAWTLFRFGPRYPEAFEGQQYPLEARQGLWKQMVPDWAYSMPAPNPTVPALGELAASLGGAVLLSHSQSGIYPFQALKRDPRGIAGIVAVEPTACPSADEDLAPYAGVPVLLLWGDHVDDSPFWGPRLQACQAFARALGKIGGRVALVRTTEHGLHGNSHMLMQDRNSLQVAALVVDWLDRELARR